MSSRRPTDVTGAFGAHRIGHDAPVLAMVALARGWLRRDDAFARVRRMAAPRTAGTPVLEGVRVPHADADLADALRRAVPGLAVVCDDEPSPRVECDATDQVVGEREHGAARPVQASSLRGGDVAAYRRLAQVTRSPLVIHVDLPSDPDDALLHGAAVAGSLLCDGIGDAVRFGGPHEPERLLEMVLGVLQACRLRASRTEYIACPGCGRTLFDLETTTQRIKARTGHLPGVKIAVMGCIVNGPGEMADADFGYVGSSPGFVNLYVGKDLVCRNVPESEADDRLVALLRERGAWRDPEGGGGRG